MPSAFSGLTSPAPYSISQPISPKSFAEESKHYNLDIDQIAQILSIINASGSELINDYQGIIKKILQLNSTGISKLINYADDLIRLKEYRFIKKQTQENE